MWIPPYLPSFLPLSLKHTLSETANRMYVSVAIKLMLIDQLLLLHLFVVAFLSTFLKSALNTVRLYLM